MMRTELGQGDEVAKPKALWRHLQQEQVSRTLRVNGKTRVTIEYRQKVDGSVEPLKFHATVTSTLHAEPPKATRCKEVAGYTGSDSAAPSMEGMN